MGNIQSLACIEILRIVNDLRDIEDKRYGHYYRRGLSDHIIYALEGSIFITGGAVRCVRDGMKIIRDATET
jgi:hypothetical protein